MSFNLVFSKKRKKIEIRCYAVSLPGAGPGPSPAPKPTGGELAFKAAVATGKAIISSRATQFYVGTVVGQTIPVLHQKIVGEKDLKGAAVYLFGALFKGKFSEKSNLEKSVELAAVQSIKILTADQRKDVYREVKSLYGQETLTELKRLVHLRGGGVTYDSFIEYFLSRKFFNEMFFLYIVYSFCKHFLIELDKEIQANPFLTKEYHSWYLRHVVLPGFTLENQDYMLNFLTDDLIFSESPF